MFFAFTWSSHFFSLQCIFTNWEPHSIKMLPWELPSLLITVFITFNNLSTLFLFSLWTLIFTICSFSAFKFVIFWFHAFLCIQQSLFVFSLFITLQSFSTFTFNFIWLTTKSWKQNQQQLCFSPLFCRDLVSICPWSIQIHQYFGHFSPRFSCSTEIVLYNTVEALLVTTLISGQLYSCSYNHLCENPNCDFNFVMKPLITEGSCKRPRPLLGLPN